MALTLGPSGLPDCVTTNPEMYSVVAEIPNARLVLMSAKPGTEDKPHGHPSHSMYFLNDAKLAISDPPGSEPNVVEIPSGAAPIFPAGSHQVKNVGDSTANILFVEPMPTCVPCGDVDNSVSPFTVSPNCYSTLAENDDWVTGMCEVPVGGSDTLHHHKDHLIYVISGNEVTIYEDGNTTDPAKAHAVPIKAGAGIPAPIAAGAIFAHHTLKNTGTEPIKMLFFEMKK